LSKYCYDDYVSRLNLSEKIYYQLEDLLLDFIDYVPLDFKHMTVYSHRLITIILEVGPEIFNAFDLAISQERLSSSFNEKIRQAKKDLLQKEQKLKKRKKSLTFKDYYDFLNTYPSIKISSAKITVFDLNAYIMPFEEMNSDWWESYNNLRHDKYNHLKEATLRNAITSLGALYWLVYNNKEKNARTVEDLISSDLFSEYYPEYTKNSRKF